MPTALVQHQHQRAAAGPEQVDEIVEHGVLAALHGRGRADHDQPDEQIARHLLEPVDARQPQKAHEHLQEHGAGHDRQDQPADMAQRIVGAGPQSRRAPAIGGAVARIVWPWGYLTARMKSTILLASLPAGVA